MPTVTKKGIAAWAVRLACTLALVLVAFAHRPATTGPVPAPELAAYMLPDGTLPDLCITSSGTDGPVHHHERPCEFCRIAGAIALPEPPALPQSAYGPLRSAPAKAPAAVLTVVFSFPPAAPPQGPPFA